MDGMDDQSSVIISFAENGMDTANAKRKIHFMNVITEYFPINGLNMPRYIEKLRQFNIIMKTPNNVVSCAPASVAVLFIIKYMIPTKLMATPAAF